MQIAVIGAGLAGLTAATDLREAGHDVVVWEKSRGAGGRTSTRRGPGGIRFDHGAPFLHDAAGDARLSGLPALAEHELTLQGGPRRVEIVGDGSANSPAKALAAGLDLRAGVRVGGIARDGARWALTDDGGAPLDGADAVIVTAPAPQAEALLRDTSPALADQAATVAFDPCWAVMAAWEQPLGLPFDAVASAHGLQWAVAEGAKPGRAPGERWVIHADPSLSTELLEANADEVGPLLLDRFAAIAGRALETPHHLAAHRWLYSRPSAPLSVAYLQDDTLLAAGDWCGGSTAGAAIRSGRAAAAALLH